MTIKHNLAPGFRAYSDTGRYANHNSGISSNSNSDGSSNNRSSISSSSRSCVCCFFSVRKQII